LLKRNLGLHIIREDLEESGIPGFPNEDGKEDQLDGDTICMLNGGYAVIGGDDVLLEPECCCDFTNLYYWKKALHDRPSKGLVWIGHPEAEVCFQGDFLTVRERWEYPPEPDCLVEFEVSVNEMSAAVERVERLLSQFEDLALIRVKELISDPALALKVTRCLIGTYN